MTENIPKKISYTCKDGNIVTINTRISSRARRFTMRLSEGTFTLVVPLGISNEVFTKILPRFYPWIEDRHIEARINKIDQNFPQTVAIPLENKSYNVLLNPKIEDLYKRIDGALFSLSVRTADASHVIYALSFPESIEFFGDIENKTLCVFALQTWIRRKADYLLVKHVQDLSKKLQIPIAKVTVRDQRSRWGSCSGKKGQLHNININWRALLLRIELVDQLCHHELCHVLYMNHSKEFHNELKKLNPNAEYLEKELDNAWKELPWWCRHIENLE